MPTPRTISPPASDCTEEIRREAERAILECDSIPELAKRIYDQPVADRLAFINCSQHFYTQLLRLGRQEALVDRFGRLEPKFGDLSEFCKEHRQEARRELSAMTAKAPSTAAKAPLAAPSAAPAAAYPTAAYPPAAYPAMPLPLPPGGNPALPPATPKVRAIRRQVAVKPAPTIINNYYYGTVRTVVNHTDHLKTK